MKNNIMIVLLLSCMSSASISAMLKEPMVMLDMEPIGENIYRRPCQHELVAIGSMSHDVRYPIFNGRRYEKNKKIFYKTYWVDNTGAPIADADCYKYQVHGDWNKLMALSCKAQYNQNSGDYAQL